MLASQGAVVAAGSSVHDIFLGCWSLFAPEVVEIRELVGLLEADQNSRLAHQSPSPGSTSVVSFQNKPTFFAVDLSASSRDNLYTNPSKSSQHGGPEQSRIWPARGHEV